ncbi:MAG: hypothetical protein L6Q54_10915 [Leptospiraceae bacterium]|nr:hypothetical protein [Leptospiraceae bacterium]MCK6381739.1 hypothetical protein [Leptospiraceae bacterium]
METGKIRKYDSEITVRENDDWYYRGDQITQEKVLDFFRKNLFEDENGIFIQNTYKNLKENGYITALGFPLHITNFVKDEDELFLRGNNSECVPIKEWIFYFRPIDERIFGIRKNQKFLKYGFSRDFLNFISSYLKEIDGEYYLHLNSTKIPILRFQENFSVQSPKFN